MGVKPVYNTDRPEAHDILRRWRSIADTYDEERILIGETNVETLERTGRSSTAMGATSCTAASTSRLHVAPFEAAALRSSRQRAPRHSSPRAHGPPGAASNHDVSRLATRWAGGDPAKVKVALLILLTLRGTPFLYQGDEIGLVDGVLEQDEMLDPVGIRFWPYAGR